MSAIDTMKSTLQRFTKRSEENPVYRIEADETREISFTVNGKEATVNVAPRVLLSDALRQHLGLTGTHIGCEHGVCGMCTVIVDGEAARSCLILACQVEGSEIMTVEGLGTPDDLHPLQESFGANHALQCGFCTPGMLMSAYDLLEHEETLDRDDIADQMSGVLCRCTGYRNIVEAVSQVAEEYPDERPAPRNCGSGQHLSHGCGVTGVANPGISQDSLIRSRDTITLPTSEPTMVVEVETVVETDADEIWTIMQDTEQLARCLPGAELIEDFGNDKYVGRIKVALGPVKLSFLGDVHVVVRDQENKRIVALVEAADKGGGSVQAEVDLVIDEHPQGSVIRALGNVHMTGRIAQFGRSLGQDAVRDMFLQFTSALDATARGEEIADVGSASAFGMAKQIIKGRISGLSNKMTRKK